MTTQWNVQHLWRNLHCVFCFFFFTVHAVKSKESIAQFNSIHSFKFVPIVHPLSWVSSLRKKRTVWQLLSCVVYADPPPVRFCQTRKNKATSKLLIYVPPLSGKNDPRCTVGSKARRKSLPRLLMTLLTSIPYRALCFSPSRSHFMSVSSIFPSLTRFLVCMCNTLQKCVPTEDVVLTRAVLFAVCSSLQLHRVCLQTNRMGQLVSLTVCSADRSMGITVNTPSCFCRVVECLLLMDTPIGCFPLRQIKVCSAWGRLVDPRLFKVIRVTVHKINRLLLLPMPLCLLPPYRSVQSFSCIS